MRIWNLYPCIIRWRDSWERRLGVVPLTGAVILAKVEPLLRGDIPWQELAPLDLNRQRILLSPTEQLRFLRGYLPERRGLGTKVRFHGGARTSERQAAS